MSQSSWTKDGFGFPLFNFNQKNTDNTENIKKFIIENKDLFKHDDDTIQALNDVKEPWDFNEVLNNSVPLVVADIINKLENITCVEGYDACGDTDQVEMIGVAPQYPWNLRPEDNITREKAEEILKKYGKILGIEDEPDYFTAEYFG